jgi:hypothetical protein
MGRRGLEKLAQVIGCINSDGASFELRDVVGAILLSVSAEYVCESKSQGTYETWSLIQESSTRTDLSVSTSYKNSNCKGVAETKRWRTVIHRGVVFFMMSSCWSDLSTKPRLQLTLHMAWELPHERLSSHKLRQAYWETSCCCCIYCKLYNSMLNPEPD